MPQLMEWVEFKNGDRMFLERLSIPEDSIHVVLKRKGAKRNAVNKVIELSQAKTTMMSTRNEVTSTMEAVN